MFKDNFINTIAPLSLYQLSQIEDLTTDVFLPTKPISRFHNTRSFTFCYGDINFMWYGNNETCQRLKLEAILV